jgi:hypothetical protein
MTRHEETAAQFPASVSAERVISLFVVVLSILSILLLRSG